MLNLARNCERKEGVRERKLHLQYCSSTYKKQTLGNVHTRSRGHVLWSRLQWYVSVGSCYKQTVQAFRTGTSLIRATATELIYDVVIG